MIKKRIMLFLLFIVFLCSVTTVCATESNDTMDIVSDIDSDELISVNNDEQEDNMDKSVLSMQNEKDKSNITVDDEILSAGNKDSLSVTNQETNQYLNDIKTSTSDEFYNFVDYLINQNGFKFNTKSTDDGYTIYSNSKYSCKLYDGENYVLPAGNTYYISKNRMSYVLDEYYPDMLYSHNGNTYVDELYLGWLKNVERFHPVLNIDGTKVSISVNTAQLSPGGSDHNLPSSFDLRNVDGKYNYVTPIRNQAGSDTCWAFASIAALESFLLKNEGKSFEFSTKYDFSENNLKNVMSNIGKQGIYTRSPNDGGTDNMALAYFIRWSGPILEEYDKYELINNLKPLNNIPIEFFNSEKHVQGVKYIHKRNGDNDNDEIKKAIIDYGGVATSMWWISNYEVNNNYYYNGLANEVDSNGKPLNFGHAVCIIGWDDNYSANNFYNSKLNIKPKGNGAFIIKNSWGNSVGKDGYYYVSYYDTQLARIINSDLNDCAGVVFTSVEDKTNYGKNYNYNPQGVTLWIPMDYSNGESAKTVSYYSQWVANSDDNLKACGVYVHDACECNIKVLVDGISKGTKNNVVLPYAGFHTIQLNNMVPVKKGQKFRIELTIISNTPVKLPAEVSYTDINKTYSKTYYNAHANVDETGYFSNGQLIDITNLYPSCNICMNVYTEYKKLLDTKIDVITMSINNDIIKDITVKLSDSSNNVLRNFELISCKGSNYQVLTTNNNGEATFNTNSADICIYYLGSAIYNSAFKELNINNIFSKIETTPVNVQPTTPQTVNTPITPNPTTNIPNTPAITKLPAKITILKISGISGKYSYKQTITLSIKAKISLSVTVKGNKKTSIVKFSNGKGKLELSKYKLKKGQHIFLFNGKTGNYEISDKKTINIK